MRITISLFIICCLLAHRGLAQSTQQIPITSIQFEGLKKTKVDYLQSFIFSQLGDSAQLEMIEADVQRLKNIAGIGNASYRIDTTKQGLQLTFEVDEVATLLPIANFGGIRDNLWFMFGVTDINWQGRGQYLSAYYLNNDRRHTGQVNYVIPFFKGNKWGLTTSFFRWASIEPLFFDEGTVNYDYDNTSLAATVIRHFGINRQLEAGGSYFVEKYKKSSDQFLENPPGPNELRQPKWLTKVEYRENFLNYHFFYLEGLSWYLRWQNVYNTLDEDWFNMLQFQGRQFTRLGEKANIAGRLRLAISTNNATPFAPFVADSRVNIRGIGNRIDRGTAQVVLNLEYRQTLLQTNTWGIQAVGFSDWGSWRKPGGELEDIFSTEQFRHFVGGGFRLIYLKIYGAILRVDYGVDIFDPQQRGVVLGLGQYF